MCLCKQRDICITCSVLSDEGHTVIDQCFAVSMNIIIMYGYIFTVEEHE
jgi:hypothetical protein